MKAGGYMTKIFMSSSMSLCKGLITHDTSDADENTENKNEIDDDEEEEK